MHPVEEAKAYDKLINKYDFTQERLAEEVGKSRTTITNTLKINTLPDDIKQKCLRVNIPKRAIMAVARQSDEKTC